MGKNIQISDARHHDQRFLTALDGWNYQGEYREAYLQQRREHWSSVLGNDQNPEKKVLVAREGGLYIGYIAVSTIADSSGYELCLGPCARDTETIAKLLLDRMGIVPIEVAMPIPEPFIEGMAVA